MTSSLDARVFGGDDVEVLLREDREGLLTGTWSGAELAAGTLVGRRDGRDVSWAFSWLGRNGAFRTGVSEVRVEQGDGSGLLRLCESWRLTSRDGAGVRELVQVPGPRWARVRVAHPTRSLAAAVPFYEALGLEVTGGFEHHELYDGVFLGLPGGGQLELTEGGPDPLPSTDDDLLVLYLATPDDVAALRERVDASGVPLLRSLNPYWDRVGFTVRDPDGRLVVVAHPPA